MCEPEHFYGYMQTPSGRVKSIVSPDPVASWPLDYNLGYQDPAPHWFMGHRIKGADLDLLAAPPLPGHHPQNLWQLLPGEKREWTIYIRDLADPDDFERTVAAAAKTPAIAMERTSFAPGEEISFIVYGEHPRCLLGASPVPLKRVGVGEWLASARNIPSGIHEVSVSDRGKSAHGYVNVRFPWRSTMELARMGAERYKQKATSHVESWYGFHTAFLAARHFPDSAIDSRLNRRFDLVFNNLYAPDGSPRNYAWRIQNTASTVGILVDRFEAYGDTADLRRAEQLADWMIGFSQKESGAFMNGNTVYSSVIYPAKSLLELADAEAAAGRSEAEARYTGSARRAVDQLVASQGDFNTEGEITYEDGMVSCSALQMGAMALHTTDPTAREHYTAAMLDILRGHDCLVQRRVPDGRRRGGKSRNPIPRSPPTSRRSAPRTPICILTPTISSVKPTSI